MNEEIKRQTIGEVKVTNKKSRERNKNIVLGRENKLREDNIALIRKEAYLQGAKDAIEAIDNGLTDGLSESIVKNNIFPSYSEAQVIAFNKAQQFIDSLEGKE